VLGMLIWVESKQFDSNQSRRDSRNGKRERMKALEREVRELRQANEILRKASAYFAQSELGRPFKP
jgi:transposase